MVETEAGSFPKKLSLRVLNRTFCCRGDYDSRRISSTGWVDFRETSRGRGEKLLSEKSGHDRERERDKKWTDAVH